MAKISPLSCTGMFESCRPFDAHNCSVFRPRKIPSGPVSQLVWTRREDVRLPKISMFQGERNKRLTLIKVMWEQLIIVLLRELTRGSWPYFSSQMTEVQLSRDVGRRL